MELKWHRTTKGDAKWIAIETWVTAASGQVIRVHEGFGEDEQGQPRMSSRLGRDSRHKSKRGFQNKIRCLNSKYGICVPMPEFEFKPNERVVYRRALPVSV